MNNRSEALLLAMKTLADATRMRLVALCRSGECSVSELAGVIGLSQPRTSQQLKLLCDAGLLQRFRDGQRMYYQVPTRNAAVSRQLFKLIPDTDPVFCDDLSRLKQVRGAKVAESSSPESDEAGNRAIQREIVELTVTTPLGDLLDVGCGRGRMLKLLASRANRAVGVDIDGDARQLARAELMLAGIPNCNLRQGDMYRLPFVDAEFDTVIVDDVIVDAAEPVRVLREARRLLKPGGRLFVLQSVTQNSLADTRELIAQSSAEAGLRLAPARLAPKVNPAWLLSVATVADSQTAAA
jgi:ArsR family transcriptional regulator